MFHSKALEQAGVDGTRTYVDVDKKADSNVNTNIRGLRLDLSVSEKATHYWEILSFQHRTTRCRTKYGSQLTSYKGAKNHRILASKEFDVRHLGSKHSREDDSNVYNCIISPSLVRSRATKFGPTRTEISRQEEEV